MKLFASTAEESKKSSRMVRSSPCCKFLGPSHVRLYPRDQLTCKTALRRKPNPVRSCFGGPYRSFARAEKARSTLHLVSPRSRLRCLPLLQVHPRYLESKCRLRKMPTRGHPFSWQIKKPRYGSRGLAVKNHCVAALGEVSLPHSVTVL